MAKGSDVMEAIDDVKVDGDEDGEVVEDGDDGDDEDSEDSEDGEADDVSGEGGDADDGADEGVTRYFLRPRVERQQRFAAARVDGGDGNDRYYDPYFDVSVSGVDDDDVAEDGDAHGGRVGCHDGCCRDTGK